MDIIDVGDARRFSSDKPVRFSLLDRPRLVGDLICLEPGQEESRREYTASDELYYVVEGAAVIRVGTHEYHVAAQQAFLVPPGLQHQIANPGPGRLTALALVTPKPGREAETRPRWQRPPARREGETDGRGPEDDRTPRGRGFAGAGPRFAGSRGDARRESARQFGGRRSGEDRAGPDLERGGPGRTDSRARPGRPAGGGGPAGRPSGTGARDRRGPPPGGPGGRRRDTSGEGPSWPGSRPQGRGRPPGTSGPRPPRGGPRSDSEGSPPPDRPRTAGARPAGRGPAGRPPARPGGGRGGPGGRPGGATGPGSRTRGPGGGPPRGRGGPGAGRPRGRPRPPG
jgi:translation initiation factor IF-2